MRLDVQGIEFAYASTTVLKDISFEAKPGEMIGILGPNGSGKTTILKCMNRALKPKAGTVFVEGKEVAELSRKQIANEMGVVPQNSGVNFPFTALEIVMMGRGPSLSKFRREDESDIQIVKEAMRAADVIHLAGRHMTELSGGEKQRVIIARALAQKPKILLLDEPTLHLDVNHQIEILELVHGLAEKEELTVIMVSHDLNLAARYCDKLLLLQKGRILAAGPVSEVLTQENIGKVFGIRAIVEYDPRIASYNVMVVGCAERKEGPGERCKPPSTS